MIKNNRGDVPITILVLGIVAVCILAIASFGIHSFKAQKNFDIQIVKEVKLIKEKSEVYKNLALDSREIDSFLEIKTDGQGRYILLEREGISVRADLG